MSLRIVNARIVNEGRIFEGDIRIVGQRIAAIGAALPGTPGEQVIDAAGRLLLPGMIDDQVHFREPGLTHKGDLASESRAALAGGITSFMEMPNTNPLTVDAAALLDKHDRAARTSFGNWAFYFGATNDNLEAVRRVDAALACGVKVFMGASTGNMLVDNPATLEGIFSGTSLLVATHCEDTPTILANEAAARARYGDAVPMREHPLIRSEECCWKSSSLAVGLAKKHGTRLHVLHLTTARELALFTAGPVIDSSGVRKQITVEACAHHLFFDDTWYDRKGADIKCNPAIKTPADRAALIAAVNADVIDVIATDHAPHTRAEKSRDYFTSSAGLPLVQHALVSVLEHWHSGTMTLETIVNKTAHAPARLFDVQERGFVREGYFADLVLIDPHALAAVNDEPVYSKCGWTPFADLVFRSRVVATLVNGAVVYQDGVFTADRHAMALTFDRP